MTANNFRRLGPSAILAAALGVPFLLRRRRKLALG
jgi:hypothetical protein